MSLHSSGVGGGQIMSPLPIGPLSLGMSRWGGQGQYPHCPRGMRHPSPTGRTPSRGVFQAPRLILPLPAFRQGRKRQDDLVLLHKARTCPHQRPLLTSHVHFQCWRLHLNAESPFPSLHSMTPIFNCLNNIKELLEDFRQPTDPIE